MAKVAKIINTEETRNRLWSAKCFCCQDWVMVLRAKRVLMMTALTTRLILKNFLSLSV